MDKVKIFPEDQEKESILEKQVKISLSVSLKHIILAFLLISAFLLGRYIFPTENAIVIGDISLFSSSAEQQQEKSDSTELQAVVNATPKAVSNTTKTNTTLVKSLNKNNTITSLTSNTSTSSNNATTITSNYKNIKLEFSQTPLFNWKGNWGKIRTIYYKITNNEVGTILPADIIISLEGYETLPRTVHIPSMDTVINAGEAKAHGVDVDIAYNQAITDPTNIQVTMQLFDKNNRSMTATTKEFNLKE